MVFQGCNILLMVVFLQGCNDGNPIRHGDKKTGKCVVTLGREFFYLKYQLRVYVRNVKGDGPIPDPVDGLSAVKGTEIVTNWHNFLLSLVWFGGYAEPLSPATNELKNPG